MFTVIFACTFLLPIADAQAPVQQPRLPVLTNEEAWKRMPSSPVSTQELPLWARKLAGPLPLTTARMLELDAMHRSGDKLDARLRSLVRWTAADANRCAYAKAIAAADFKRAGGREEDLELAASQVDRLPELDRVAIAFARKMMEAAHTVTDAEVQRLIDLAGEERVVALVALLAHASFQDRIFFALNLPVEADGALPPLAARFDWPKQAAKGPSAKKDKPAVPEQGQAAPTPQWLRLQQGLDQQRARKGRIRMPSTKEVLQRLGENHPDAWQAAIHWSRVCFGFQPELTVAWFQCSNAFRHESSLDRVFQNSIFWVVTNANNCFY